MGMFDWIEYESEECPKELFQTKSLGCNGMVYKIKNDRLYRRDYRGFFIPQGELPYINRRWGFRVIENPHYRYVSINMGQHPVEFTGTIRFYCYTDISHPLSSWYEYDATFTDGELQSIRRIEGGPWPIEEQP